MKRRQFMTALAVAAPLVSQAAAAAATRARFEGHKVPATIEALPFSSAAAAADAVRSGKISSSALLEMTLSRVTAINPAINAIVEIFEDEARLAARRCDEALRSGRTLGPLHGVPVTVKESHAIAGHVQTYGSPALANNRQQSDTLVVERLRRSGAIIIGRTNVPLFANDWQTFNTVYGVTNNPWDLTRTPGGSSGGCAAALSAGLSFLSLGGDLGGSIRVPAHFCGLFGHRPTRGIMPVKELSPTVPPTPLWEAFVPGPLARDATDLELAIEILAGPAAPESAGLKWKMPPARKSRLEDYRIGFILDDEYCPLEPALRELYQITIDKLRRAGATLVEGWPKGFSLRQNYLVWAYLTTAGASSGNGVEMLVRGKRPPGDITYFEMARQAETGTFFDYKRQHHQRLLIQRTWQQYFSSFDAFLFPPSFVSAFRHGPDMRDTNILQTPSGERCYGHLNVWPSVSGLSGNPSTIVPVGRTSVGMPAGLEILGPAFEDRTPIDLARRISQVAGRLEYPDLEVAR